MNPVTLQDDRQRFRPSLLERLRTDIGPANTESEFRSYLIRDLGWLLNSRAPQAPRSGPSIKDFREAADSVLNYGLSGLGGSLAARMDPAVIIRLLSEAIRRFEPRLGNPVITLLNLGPTDMLREGVLSFEITGHPIIDPETVGSPVRLRSDLDIASGAATVFDMSDDHD